MTRPPSDALLASGRPDPLWSRVAGSILAAVEAGQYPLGTRLPPERELCEQLDVSRVTLRRALAHLVEAGALTSHQGRGWFVSRPPRGDWPSSLESFSETAERLGLAASSTVVEAVREASSLDDAEALGIAPGTPVYRIRRIRHLDGVPTALDTAVVPEAAAPGLLDHDFTSESLYRAMQACGATVHRAESVLESRPADAAASEALQLGRGAPMLVIRQLVHDERGRAVLLSLVEYAGDRYRLRTTFTKGG